MTRQEINLWQRHRRPPPAALEERIVRLEAERNVPMPTERLARIEGAYEHLATKADIQALKSDIADVRGTVQAVQSELRALKWLMGLGVAGLLIPLIRDLLAQLP